MGETETVVLIEAVRECAMGLIVDATISPISPFRFFFFEFVTLWKWRPIAGKNF